MANKFKEGDKVILSDQQGFNKWMTNRWEQSAFAHTSKDIRDVLQVRSVDQWDWTDDIASNSFTTVDSKIYGGLIPEQFFELATVEQPINTYGFKIGDVIDGNILNKWCKAGKNEYSVHIKEWRVQTAPWGGENHTISEFTVCPNGISGFKIGAGNLTSIRAEGFKDFIEAQSAPPMPASAPKPKFKIDDRVHFTGKGAMIGNISGAPLSEENSGKVSGSFSILDVRWVEQRHEWCYLTSASSKYCTEDAIELNLNAINQHGLEIGFKFSAAEINAWTRKDDNESYCESEWKRSGSSWSLDYCIDVLEQFKGVTAFTWNAAPRFRYKAEGFYDHCMEMRRVPAISAPVKSVSDVADIMSNYGLKVGDVFPMGCINEWLKEPGDKEFLGDTWKGESTPYEGKEYNIVRFKILDGILAFTMFDSSDIAIKAEGFKAFYTAWKNRQVPPELPFDPQGSYYGLKVGDPVYLGPLNEWIFRGINERRIDEGWRKGYSTWDGDNSYISNFHKFSDGIIGFRMSRSEAFYIRAEGFVQFCEEYRRSKSVFPVDKLEQRLEELKKEYPLKPSDVYPINQHVDRAYRDNFKPIVHTEDEVVVKVDFNDKSYLSDPMNQEFQVTYEETDPEDSHMIAIQKSLARPVVNPEEDDLPF